MIKSLIGPILLTIALAACASPAPQAPLASSPAATPAASPAASNYKVGERVTLTGQLVIKGSMPMLQAVLIRESGERWELKDVQPMDAARLQNKAITVEGKVARNAATAMLYPSLAVTGIVLSAKP